jgi:hypothetical protein
MDKAFASQSSLERLKAINNSSIDNRVRGLHIRLVDQLRDGQYDIGHTYKIAKRFSDHEIVSAAEYCVRKATHPGKAFVALFEKKMAN